MSISTDEVTPGPTVTINGREYPTELIGGVQRFVRNSVVVELGTRLAFHDYYYLNSLALEVVQGILSLEDYIVYETMTGWSVCGLIDSISSLVEMNPEAFPGGCEKHFVLANPLWDEAE